MDFEHLQVEEEGGFDDDEEEEEIPENETTEARQARLARERKKHLEWVEKEVRFQFN